MCRVAHFICFEKSLSTDVIECFLSHVLERRQCIFSCAEVESGGACVADRYPVLRYHWYEVLLMQITYHGQTCLKISVGETTVLVNPYGGKNGMRAGQQADIVIIGEVPENEAREVVAGQPFFITGPGEYETKGVFIYGIPAVDDEGKLTGSTFFVVKAEGMTVGLLGNLRQQRFTEEQLEIVGASDIMIVHPGEGVSATDIAGRIMQVEPRVVVVTKSNGAEDAVFKAVAAKNVESVDKVKIAARALPQEDMMYMALDRI